MKHSFYWKVTNGKRTYFVIEETAKRWSFRLKKALKNLPFKGVNDFSELANSDFYKFLLDLHSSGYSIMDINGKITKTTRSEDTEIAGSIFDSAVTQYIAGWRDKFDERIIERNRNCIGSKIRVSAKIHESLNECLIYFAACQTYQDWVLEESRFFSLALILDSMLELEASLLLSANFYYKQAVQVLRNFLELVVAQYYFSTDTSVYDDWRLKQDFKMPMFRGKNGMITILESRGKVSPSEGIYMSILYGTLSAYTHSRYDKLAHFDPKTKKCIPFDYNEDHLSDWIELAVQCMELGLTLLAKQTEDWERQLERTQVLTCPECHFDQFTVSTEKYGYKKLYLYSCKNCNNQLRIDKPPI